MPIHISRRDFIQASAIAAAGLILSPRLVRAAAPVRLRGRVLSGGRGLAGVSVSDGLQVVATGPDGGFELISDGARRYLAVSPPRGYDFPVQPAGTFRFFERLAPDARGEQAVRFDLPRLQGDDTRHGVIVLGDTQTADAGEMARLHAETVPDVIETMRNLGDVPLFGIADGDIMYDDLALYPEYERAVTRMGIPFGQVVGNHDLDFKVDGDGASTATFERHFGPRYYSFNRGEFHYVVLDDVFWHGTGYLGYVEEEQLRWLAADLARVEKGSPVMVFLHIPLLPTQGPRHGRRPEISSSVTNRDALLRLLEPYQAMLISAHMHENDHMLHGERIREWNIGTSCGAWWTGDICYDGTPNGYGILDVNGRSLRWLYKATGQGPGYQLKVHRRGADPAAPDEIVANVWNWDPDWTVTYFVNGERRGAMARRIGMDPDSVAQHTGPDLPKKRGWVEPQNTNHHFYAPVPADAREVVVEAKDPWGGVYTGRI